MYHCEQPHVHVGADGAAVDFPYVVSKRLCTLQTEYQFIKNHGLISHLPRPEAALEVLEAVDGKRLCVNARLQSPVSNHKGPCVERDAVVEARAAYRSLKSLVVAPTQPMDSLTESEIW